VLLTQEAEHAAVRILAIGAACPGGRAEQQHARGAGLMDVILLVGCSPAKNWRDRFERLAILKIERSVHFEGERAAVRQVLPTAQRNLFPRHGGEAPPEIHEL